MKFLMELALLIILMPIVLVFAIIYYMIEKIGDYKAAKKVRKTTKRSKK